MKISNYINLLLSIPLFNVFEKDELYTMLERESSIQSFMSNQIIYLQNEKAYTMDIILEGSIIIQNIDEKGNILSIATLDVGDMLGGNLIYSDKNEYPMTIIAKTNVKLLRIRKNTILNLCQINKDFLLNLLMLFSDKALVLTNKINSLAKKTIREKIMEFLLFEINRQKSNTIILPLSKKELSERFGVERPSLQRELSKMKEEGLIHYDARSISLLK